MRLIVPHKTPEGRAENDALITKAIGNELKRARKDKGWSVRELVQRIGHGMKVNTYSCYEQGIRQCPTPRLFDICKALGIAPGVLLDLARQRAAIDLYDQVLRVDICLLASSELELPDQLRQWAKDRPQFYPETIITLDQVVIQEIATLLGLPRSELVDILREFTPSAMQLQAESDSTQ